MSLKLSYTLIAPFYDALLDAGTRRARQRSLQPLVDAPVQEVLLLGIGTGLDLPHLPVQHRYVGLDLTAAMLDRALPRTKRLDFVSLRGDAQRLPFPAGSFDTVVMHLILAVVPAPTFCLREAVRVLKPGGQALVFDKFLRPGEGGWKKRLSAVSRHVATRLDVVFEDLLAESDGIEVLANQPALGDGWFRLIRLRKPAVP